MPFPIRLSDVMSAPVHTTGPDTTAAEAATTCTEEDIGSLVVVEDGQPVGIVTSDDFVTLLGSAEDPGSRAVSEFMSAPVLAIESEAPVGEAVERMVESDVSRLAVTEAGDLVGLVSSDDIVEYVPQVFHRQRFETPPGDGPQYLIRQGTDYEAPDWESECTCHSEESVSVGDRVTFSKTLGEQDVRAFATASGDTNRLHLDAEYAEGTRFGRRIVHGTLVSGIISAALARLPGVTIYVSQDLSFLAPVDIGDRVTAVCTVTEEVGDGKFALTTDVEDEDGERVVEGQAVVLVDAPPEAADLQVETLA